MYTVSGASINGMYAFYTASTADNITPISSGGVLSTALANTLNAGGGVIRVHNISNISSGGSYRFIGNTAENNIDLVGGLPFSAGVCIKAVGLANLCPAINTDDCAVNIVSAYYSSDTLFSYGALTSNNVVPANGAVTLICEVS